MKYSQVHPSKNVCNNRWRLKASKPKRETNYSLFTIQLSLVRVQNDKMKSNGHLEWRFPNSTLYFSFVCTFFPPLAPPHRHNTRINKINFYFMPFMARANILPLTKHISFNTHWALLSRASSIDHLGQSCEGEQGGGVEFSFHSRPKRREKCFNQQFLRFVYKSVPCLVGLEQTFNKLRRKNLRRITAYTVPTIKAHTWMKHKFLCQTFSYSKKEGGNPSERELSGENCRSFEGLLSSLFIPCVPFTHPRISIFHSHKSARNVKTSE